MINLGLSRIQQLIHQLRNPLAGLKTFHVTGTNGKGSVCTYLESVLSARHENVGKFTSPHLITPNDSIRIGQKELPLNEYNQLTQYVKSVSDKYNIGASEFEIQTAVAFKAFKDHAVDVAVIEVGMGGAEDATNILEPSNVLCSAITKISIDHEAFLGSTLASIARHKAGIIKPGVPCVVDGSNSPEFLNLVKQKADSLGSRLHITSQKGQNFIENNRAVAAEALRCVYPDISTSEIQQGIEKAHWPGRLQWLDSKTLLDGAHNPDAARELRRYIDSLEKRPIRWIVAFSKPAEPILDILYRSDDEILATEFGPVEGMPWISAQPASEVLRAAHIEPAAHRILPDLTSIPEFDGLTVICGSLYLVGSYLRLRGNSENKQVS